MAAGTLVDASGQAWPTTSRALACQLGLVPGDARLVTFAVRACGFIHITAIDDLVRVGFEAGAFSFRALVGALYEVGRWRPRRILMVVFSDQRRQVELFSGLYAFAERAEQLAAEAPIKLRVPRLLVERSLSNLRSAAFGRVAPLLDLWRQSRGRWSPEAMEALQVTGLLQRAILARQCRAGTLICEHFGRDLRIQRPCESLSAEGRELHDLYDRDYGDWLAAGYAEGLSSGRLRLQSIRAELRLSETLAVSGRYDRLLLPWQRARSENLVMGISIRRELTTTALER